MDRFFSRLFNRFRAALHFAKGRADIETSPVELIVEITSVCNLSCPMCPRPQMQRANGMMDIELFSDLIEQVKGTAELVYLAGGLGDPTIHPKLGEFIKICVENKVRVGVSTNATLLKPKVIDEILNASPDLLLLSLDGATKETHEAARLGSDFDQTMGRVENFLREKVRRNARRPYTICQMVYMPLNQDEAVQFKERWQSTPGVDEVRMKKFLHLKGADYTPEPTANGVAKDRIDVESSSCFLPWRQLAVAFDGTVALCCRDLDFRHPVGDLKTQRVEQIWRGGGMLAARQELATCGKRNLSACSGCAGIRAKPLTLLGAALVDDYAIRRLLPFAEKVTRLFGIKQLDYD